MASPGEIFLNPGDFCFTSEETRLRTLLGSCVSITMWHAGRRLGGMCHYMNPTRGHPSENEELDGRYADEAMRMFLRELNADYQKKALFFVPLIIRIKLNP